MTFREDDIVEWHDLLSYEGDINFDFSNDSWYAISGDVGMREWNAFERQNSSFVKSFLLLRKQGQVPIAMLYIIAEDIRIETVSIHGGAFSDCRPMEVVHGYIIMIESLLHAGLKVRTTCLSSNRKALNLDRNIGFVRYKQIDDTVFMWINAKRLTSTAYYKRIRICHR